MLAVVMLDPSPASEQARGPWCKRGLEGVGGKALEGEGAALSEAVCIVGLFIKLNEETNPKEGINSSLGAARFGPHLA